MKFGQKLSISLFAATASVLSFSSGAFAGEGGAAGAAAFTIDAGAVTGVAVAASVGKNDAGAAAFNNPATSYNSAFALGSGGKVSFGNMGAEDGTTTMEGETETAANLAVGQANSLTGKATIQLGTVSEDVIVTIPGDGQANP